jgi:hypothetical protein
MKQSRLNRYSLLSGIIFVILYVVTGATTTGGGEYMGPGEEVIAHFSSNSNRLMIFAYLGILSAFFLLWFAGSLRGVLAGTAQNSDSLPGIAFGGGVAASVFVALYYTGIYALAYRAGTEAGLGPETAAATDGLTGTIGGMALPVAFAALAGAAGLAVVRTKLLPAWFGWVSVIVALGLLTPGSYILIPVFLLWTLVVSLWLFFRVGRDTGQAVSPQSAESAA